ncbi:MULTISPECIES: permease [Bacillus cereus group]|uniref:Permease n=1 Tax=Bacillus cereus TaxID=1396 RepID=A0AA44Q9Q1_BACCE|nr:MULTISPECIES: permease [Bacillus cereus group]PFA24488.1 permease [Bacillus cereus]PFN05010.1 permease [Bacillus cereus]PFO84246.1 permease [Bacillus cereus]PFR25667.1 permease [Bacillus cereus]PFS00418.1 permease [Bacillus cereus]
MELFQLPKAFLQMNTIFISILIEALPFVLIGVFISGFIQMFVTEDMVAKWMPKNRFLSVLLATFLGMMFPGCECGIVPIVRRLIGKGVPPYAGIAFMLTGPIINPVVLFATYVAFGSSMHMVWYRSIVAIIVAIIVGLILSLMFKDHQLRDDHFPEVNHKRPLGKKMWDVCTHAVEEFFSMGKYLVMGALIAAAVQTFVQTSTLLAIGQGPFSSSAVMMGLAFILSLCSEADAFIASSFQSTFSTASLVAFLVYGPMVDIKNMFMMLATFKTKFVIVVIATVTIVVYASSLLIYAMGW